MRMKGYCNDTLEIYLRPNTKSIQFQMGPKTYSYSPFVEALCIYGSDQEHNSSLVSREDVAEDDDLEAFLDACDNESEGDDETTYNSSFAGSTSHAQLMTETQVKDDLSKVNSLIVTLSEVKLKLSSNEIMHNHERALSTQEKYCSILIKSEYETISFFLAIAQKLKTQLDRLNSSALLLGADEYNLDKEGLTQKHIVDVVNAFLAIKYS